MKQVRFQLRMVDALPEPLQDGVLYVTREQDLAAHLCACGCAQEVITPLSPTDWKLALHKEGASLLPSIGNWAFACRSHYFIQCGRVAWAGDMSDSAIRCGRELDRARKDRYYEGRAPSQSVPPSVAPPLGHAPSWWSRLRAWLGRFLG